MQFFSSYTGHSIIIVHLLVKQELVSQLWKRIINRGAGATGAEGAAAPVAQTVRGQHEGSKLPFLIKTYICYSYRQLN